MSIIADKAAAAFGVFTAYGAGGSITPPAFSGVTSAPLAGAGGNVTGIRFAADGTAVIRTDTSPTPFLLAPGSAQWTPACTQAGFGSLAFSQLGAGYSDGVYEVAIARSNSSVIYAIIGGFFFATSNGGTSWSYLSSLPQLTDIVNGQGPTYQDSHRMDVDPADPSIVIVVHSTLGAYQSSDGGTTFTHISGIATPVGGANVAYGNVVFDPSTTSGGSTPGIYVFSVGHGWYHSTTGATGTFTLTTSGPTASQGGACSSAGLLIACDGGGTTLHKYSGTTWSTQTVSVTSAASGDGVGVVSVYPDPNTAGRWAYSDGSGTTFVSTNSGSTWTGVPANNPAWSSGAGSVPWIVNFFATYSYTFGSSAAWNPAVSNDFWMTQGVGIMRGTPSNTTPTTPAIVDWSAGIENLASTQAQSPPGGWPVIAQWDRPWMVVTNIDGYPTTYNPQSGGNLRSGFSVGYAPAHPEVIAGIANFSSVSDLSGSTANGGSSWTTFGSVTPSQSNACNGGDILAWDSSHMFWMGTGSSPAPNPSFTSNGGTSWSTATGLAAGFHANYYEPAHYFDTDKVTAQTAYGFNPTNGIVYETSNFGAAWSSVSTPGFNLGGYAGKAQFRCVPGQAGNIFFTPGYSGSSAPDATRRLYRSVNAGATFTTVANVTEVWEMAFGAPYPGQSYPCVYIVGWVSGVYGAYRSIDNCVTWTQLGYPANLCMLCQGLGADSDAFGWTYVAMSGTGWWQTYSNDAAPWVVFATPTPGGSASHTGSLSITTNFSTKIPITSVQFQIDGANIGSLITSAPYSLTQSLSGVSTGAHTLSLIVVGNGQTMTRTINITVT